MEKNNRPEGLGNEDSTERNGKNVSLAQGVKLHFRDVLEV